MEYPDLSTAVEIDPSVIRGPDLSSAKPVDLSSDHEYALRGAVRELAINPGSEKARQVLDIQSDLGLIPREAVDDLAPPEEEEPFSIKTGVKPENLIPDTPELDQYISKQVPEVHEFMKKTADEILRADRELVISLPDSYRAPLIELSQGDIKPTDVLKSTIKGLGEVDPEDPGKIFISALATGAKAAAQVGSVLSPGPILSRIGDATKTARQATYGLTKGAAYTPPLVQDLAYSTQNLAEQLAPEFLAPGPPIRDAGFPETEFFKRPDNPSPADEVRLARLNRLLAIQRSYHDTAMVTRKVRDAFDVTDENPVTQTFELAGSAVTFPGIGAEAVSARLGARLAEAALERGYQTTAKAIQIGSRVSKVALPAVAGYELFEHGHPGLALAAILGGYGFGYRGIKHALMDKGFGKLSEFGAAMAGDKRGITVLRNSQMIAEKEAARFESQAVKLEADNPGKVKYARDRDFATKELSGVDLKVREALDNADLARSRVKSLAPWVKLNQVASYTAKLGLAAPLMMSTTGFTLAGLGALSSLPSETEEASASGFEHGVALSIPGLLPLYDRGVAGMKYGQLVARGKKLIPEADLEGLGKKERNDILAHAGFMAPLEGQVKIVDPGVIKAKEGGKEGAELIPGFFEEGTNILYLNRKSVVGQTLRHEFGHLAKKQMARSFQGLGDTIMGRINSPDITQSEPYKIFAATVRERMKKALPDFGQMSPETITEEVQAELTRIVLNNTPVSEFYGGPSGKTVLKDILRKRFSSPDDPTTIRIDLPYGSPFTEADLANVKDILYQIGEKSKIGEKLSPPAPPRPPEPSSAPIAPPGPPGAAGGAPVNPLAPPGAVEALMGLGQSREGAEAKINAALEELGDEEPTMENVMRRALPRLAPKKFMAPDSGLTGQDAEVKVAMMVRGNSRPVSREEFGQLVAQGEEQIRQRRENPQPTTGLDANWETIKEQAFSEAKKPWGGVTVDTHTGKVPSANQESGGGPFALTVRDPGQDTISLPENASREEFDAAMEKSKEAYPQLQYQDHHLGVFHDNDRGTIEIDPILIVKTPAEVESIGSYTGATGGAYDFSTGNGYFPPHIVENQGEATVNIGLAANDGGKITAEQAVAALHSKGVEVTRQSVRQSDTEPTLVATLSRPLDDKEAYGVADSLGQEAIVQRIGGEGQLHGPKKDKWGKYNNKLFLDHYDTGKYEGKTASEERSKIEARRLGLEHIGDEGNTSTYFDPATKFPFTVKRNASPGDIQAKMKSRRLAILGSEERRFMAPDSNPEAIKLAAIKLPDGTIFTGSFHADALDEAERVATLEPDKGKRRDMIKVLARAEYERGFVNNKGDFLNLVRASEAAKAAKQIAGTRIEDEFGTAPLESRRMAKSDPLTSPAIQTEDGMIFRGKSHGDALQGAAAFGKSPEELKVATKGFVSRKGTFRNQEASRAHGEDTRQLPEELKDKLTVKDFKQRRYMMPPPEEIIWDRDEKGRPNYGKPSPGYIPWRPTQEEIDASRATRPNPSGIWDAMRPDQRFDRLEQIDPANPENRKNSELRWYQFRAKNRREPLPLEPGNIIKHMAPGANVDSEPWVHRYFVLDAREQAGTITPKEAQEMDALQQRAEKEYGSYDNFYLAHGGTQYNADNLFSKNRKKREEKVLFTHYSEQPDLQELDPSYHGTGSIGEEGKRKASYSEYPDRSYVYLGEGKESFIKGENKYHGTIEPDKLYDILKDPEKLFALAQEQIKESGDYSPKDRQADITRFEKLIQDRGYEGYHDGRVAALYNKIPIKRLHMAPVSDLGFYSHLEKTVEDKVPDKASAEQILGILRNNGVKADEMKWTFTDDFLKDKKRVTKQELLDHVRENAVQIEEVIKGEQQFPVADQERLNELRHKFARAPSKITDAESAEYRQLNARQSDYLHDEDAATKFGAPDLQLSGATPGSYRELLLLLPGNKPFYGGHFDEPNILAHVRFSERKGVKGERILHLEEVQSDWHQEGGRKDTNVPDAPFKKSWPALAMNRMIHYAAEKGYDEITWTTGKQQVDRYDLSKHLKSLESTRTNDGDFVITAYNHDGAAVISGKKVSESGLSGTVGKELAQRISSDPRRDQSYEGLDLKIGGEGMKVFYDTILPSAANEIGRKFGTKAGMTEIPGANETYHDVHSLPLAPEMKKAGTRLFMAPTERISQRVPAGKRATENPLETDLHTGLDSVMLDPKHADKLAQVVREYPGFKTDSVKTRDILEDFITHVKDNLLWLHDEMPPEIREFAKLWYDGANKIAQRLAREYNIPVRAAAGVMAALSPQNAWYNNVTLAERMLDIYYHRGDAEWDDKMSQTSLNIIGDKKFDLLRGEIKGRSFSALNNNYQRAAWLRIYDEAHNPREFNIITPEGEKIGLMMTGGRPMRSAWFSFGPIEKALNVLDNPSRENIHDQMGRAHKVRNFYNNIIEPNFGIDFTNDTHAVAAALLRPLSGISAEVLHNFASGAKGIKRGPVSSLSGNKGTYALYAEAGRRAATERDLLPRQLQSITWEAARGLFPTKFKQTPRMIALAENVWYRYSNGEIDINEARNEIKRLTGGIDPPEWWNEKERRIRRVDDIASDTDNPSELPEDAVSRGSPQPFASGSRGNASRKSQRVPLPISENPF